MNEETVDYDIEDHVVLNISNTYDVYFNYTHMSKPWVIGNMKEIDPEEMMRRFRFFTSVTSKLQNKKFFRACSNISAPILENHHQVFNSDTTVIRKVNAGFDTHDRINGNNPFRAH